MKKEEILSNLCYYNSRNPDFIKNVNEGEPIEDNEGCFCDNCFYGRTKMAEYILKLLEND